MKLEPVTKREFKKVERIIKDICFIDNRMKEISDITKTRHTIIFHERLRFEVLHKICQLFSSQGVPAISRTGSGSIQLQNCTVRLYRNYKP